MIEDSEYIMGLLLCDREAIEEALDSGLPSWQGAAFQRGLRLDLARVNAEIARRITQGPEASKSEGHPLGYDIVPPKVIFGLGGVFVI